MGVVLAITLIYIGLFHTSILDPYLHSYLSSTLKPTLRIKSTIDICLDKPVYCALARLDPARC